MRTAALFMVRQTVQDFAAKMLDLGAFLFSQNLRCDLWCFFVLFFKLEIAIV